MQSLLNEIESVLRGNADPLVVQTWVFYIWGTLVATIVVVAVYSELWRFYRRIPFLESYSEMEKRVLVYQLIAGVLWTTVGLGLFVYAILSGFNIDIFTTPLGKISLVIVNWVFIGFIAVTSIGTGVSILSKRGWAERKHPIKGEDAVIGGVMILGLLAFWTWRFLFAM